MTTQAYKNECPARYYRKEQDRFICFYTEGSCNCLNPLECKVYLRETKRLPIPKEGLEVISSGWDEKI